jgi:hypothetical protein
MTTPERRTLSKSAELSLLSEEKLDDTEHIEDSWSTKQSISQSMFSNRFYCVLILSFFIYFCNTIVDFASSPSLTTTVVRNINGSNVPQV